MREVAAFGPQRRWLALASERGVDVIESETGNNMGRLAVVGTRAVMALAAHPTRDLLAAFHVRSKPPRGAARFGQAQVEQEFGLAGIWKLDDGSLTGLEFPGSSASSEIAWVNEDQVLLKGRTCIAVDIQTGRLGDLVESTAPNTRDLQEVHCMGNGRAYAKLINPTRQRLGFSPLEANPAKDAGAAQPGPFQRGDVLIQSLQVEVNTRVKQHNATFAKRIATQLVQSGIAVGPGDHILRVTGRREKSDFSLTATGNFNREISIPQMSFSWELIGPDGKKQEVAYTVGPFLKERSRFYRPSNRKRGAAFEWYDFPNGPGIDVMDEIVSCGEWLNGGLRYFNTDIKVAKVKPPAPRTGKGGFE